MSDRLFFQLTLVSANQKTGPIPVSMTSKVSCPSTCAFKAGGGCYAENGGLGINWNKLGRGQGRALTAEQFLGAIKVLPRGQLWRHNQAGDLPHDPDTGRIFPHFLYQLAQANKGKRGFTYTHHKWEEWEGGVHNGCEYGQQNRDFIQQANANGFTINVSCETAEQVDRACSYGLPSVIAVPKGTPDRWHTPKGNLVITCPAVTQDNVTCARCGLCQRVYTGTSQTTSKLRHTVAFPVHGNGAKKAERKLLELRVL